MTDLEALAARVEGTTAGDRDLDALIAPVQGLRVVDEGHPLGRCCYDQDRRAVVLPRYTASLDAAMTLIPAGWRLSMLSSSDFSRTWVALLWVDDSNMDLRPNAPSGRASTAALATTAAALRARAAHLTAGATHDR